MRPSSRRTVKVAPTTRSCWLAAQSLSWPLPAALPSSGVRLRAEAIEPWLSFLMAAVCAALNLVERTVDRDKSFWRHEIGTRGPVGQIDRIDVAFFDEGPAHGFFIGVSPFRRCGFSASMHLEASPWSHLPENASTHHTLQITSSDNVFR